MPSITTILATDLISDSRAVINTNFSNINAYIGTNTTPTTPGAANRVLRSTSATATEWAALNLSTDVTGALSIANGGTGQTTAVNAFDALAPTTTKGDIIVNNGTDNIRLPVGTNGQVLTADSTQDSGVKWATVGGGGGGGVNEFTHVMWARDFSFPNSNFPALNKTVGTNWVYETLDFDQSTQESCYAVIPIPPSATPATMKLHWFWTASAGTGNVKWQVIRRSIADDEVIDATTTPATITDTVTDTLIATGDLHVATMTLTTGTDSVANDLLQLKISRLAADAADTLTADAKLIALIFEITN